jgi:hypothetical protein
MSNKPSPKPEMDSGDGPQKSARMDEFFPVLNQTAGSEKLWWPTSEDLSSWMNSSPSEAPNH